MAHSVAELPVSQRIVAQLYMMSSCGEEAEKRRNLGLPVDGMTEAEAIRYAQTGEYVPEGTAR